MSDATKQAQLERLIEALAIAEDEFSFQVKRLNDHVRPRTGEEEKYFEDLKAGYTLGAYYARLLKRYHEGRLDRLKTTGNAGLESPYAETGNIVDGRATAHYGEE